MTSITALATVTITDEQNRKVTLPIGKRDDMLIPLYHLHYPKHAVFSQEVPWWLVKYLADEGLESISAPNGTDAVSLVALAHAQKRSVLIEK